MTLGTWLAVAAQTDHPEVAAEIVKAMATREAQLTLSSEIGFIPTRMSAREEFLSMNTDNALLFDAVQNGRDYGVMSERFFDALQVLRPALEEAFYGRKTPAAALQDAAAAYREE